MNNNRTLRNVGYACVVAIAASSVHSYAERLSIQLLTNNGEPARGIGIAVEPLDKQNMPKRDASYIMDQVDTQFKPHILMVQRDSDVKFPNSDSVKHHVYSFSEAKTFELKLYKDKAPEPVHFDDAGEIVLGCNIHDWMLGYIYVVDTPWFGRTNQQGTLQLDVPQGRYQLRLYSPQLQASDINTSLSVAISTDHTQNIQLTQPLLPILDGYEQGDELDGY